MQTWLIEPRDPLIVRDGRPFSADIAGARATSLDFPFPSTTTGGVRTRQGLASGGFANRPPEEVQELIRQLKDEIAVRGPLLVELNGEGKLPTGCCLRQPMRCGAIWMTALAAFAKIARG